MPTVQTYGARRVDLEPLPAARKTGAPTALSEGAGVEEAKGRTALAMGGALSGAAKAVFDVVQQEHERADEVQVLGYDGALGAWANKAVTAALQTKGMNAQGIPEQLQREFEEVADAEDAKLTNPAQRRAAAKIRAKYSLDIDAQARRHSYGEIERIYAENQQAVIQNTIEHAVLVGDTPITGVERVGEDLRKLDGLITEGGKRLGWGDAQRQRAIEAAHTATHTGLIDKLHSQGRDKDAAAYFAMVEQDIHGAEQTKTREKVEAYSQAGEGHRIANEVWADLFKPGDDTAIELDKMQEKAEQLAQGDEKVYAMALNFLKEKKAVVEAGRIQRIAKARGTLNLKVAQGAPLPALITTPEWGQVTDGDRAEVMKDVVNTATALANKDQNLRSKVEQEKEQANWPAYWSYASDLDGMTKMTVSEIEALRVKIGDGHTNRLQSLKQQLGKGEAVVRSVTVDADMFKTKAAAAGLPVWKSATANPSNGGMTEAEKGGLGALEAAVKRTIAAEQTATGKELTFERKEQLTQQVIDNTVLIESSWMGHSHDPKSASKRLPAAYAGYRDPGGVVRTVNAGDWKRAYIPLPDFAGSQLYKGLVDNLKAFYSTSLKNVPDEEVARRFQTGIEHAAALRMMGATPEEVEKALRGSALPLKPK